MFKNRLDKHQENQDIWYNYRAALVTTIDSKVNLGTDETLIQENALPQHNNTIMENPA